MSEQVQKVRSAKEQEMDHLAEEDAKAEAAARTPEQQDLIDASDDILDEIDKALEGLDQDLAVTYIQQGGE